MNDVTASSVDGSSTNYTAQQSDRKAAVAVYVVRVQKHIMHFSSRQTKDKNNTASMEEIY